MDYLFPTHIIFSLLAKFSSSHVVFPWLPSRCMHPQYRRALARVAVTPLPSKGCGYNGRCYSGQRSRRSRNISETSSALDTNTGHPQPCARSQSRPTGYRTGLLLQAYEILPSARRDMNPPKNSDTLPSYDWRTFAAPGAQLHYIRSEDVANERLARITSRPGPFTIGLDFEWRPNFIARRPENPIALIQVACDDEILLVQVSAMQGFPTKLRDLLESAKSTKVGVGIQYDCKKLWKDHRVSVGNCVDLALLARSVDAQWKGPYKAGIGLSRLAEMYLERKLPKGGIQTSDWEMELSTPQLEYAANDSHASLTIHRVLEQRALEISPVPEPEWFTFHGVRGVLRDNEGRPWFPYNPRYDPGPPSSSGDSDTGTAYASYPGS